MKILKIFGVVVGIHVFALILIFANPGCSSAKQPPASETIIASGDAPASPAAAGGERSDSLMMPAPVEMPSAPGPVSFDPNAPAPAVRFSPTRPGTPAAATLEAQPVTDVTPATTYTVAKGDSLWTIARRQNSSVAEIAAANNLKASATVRVGQKLIIPAKAVAGISAHVEPTDTAAAVPSVPAASRRSVDAVKHVVRPGETLGAIARKYQVKVGEIATANNISDPARIRPGMELTIPGWQAPAGRTGSTTAPRPSAPVTTPVQTPAAATPAPADSIPTIVIPSTESDLDNGLKTKTGEPPVIEVEAK